MHEHAKKNAGYTALAALLMLFYGWYRAGTVVIGPTSTFYDTTVHFFNWMLVIGGVALALAAALCFFGLRFGLLLDSAVSGLCGLTMTLCGGYWLKDGLDIQYALIAVFGCFFMRAAMGSWAVYRGPEAVAEGAEPAEEIPSGGNAGAKEPVHPAGVHPESLPKDGQAPPPDGYLAALSKEKDEPPAASNE